METTRQIALAAMALASLTCGKGDRTKIDIEVLNTGLGDRHALHLDFSAGDEQQGEMQFEVTTDVPGARFEELRMRLGYVLEVSRVEQSGKRRVGHLALTFTEAEAAVTPSTPETQRLSQDLEQLEGEKLLASVDQMGRPGYVRPVGDRVYPLFASLGVDSQQVEQIFADIYPDLPSEPLAIGSSWRIQKQTRRGPHDLQIDVKCELIRARQLPDRRRQIFLTLQGRAQVKGGGGGEVSGELVYLPFRGRALSGRIVTDITTGSGAKTGHTKTVFAYKHW